MSSARPRHVVFLSGVSWEAVKGTDRHLAENLGRSRPVLWVEPPVSWARVFADGDYRRLRHMVEVQADVAPGVTRVNIVTSPFPSRRGWSRLATAIAALGLRRQMRRLDVSAPWILNTSPHTSFRVLRRGGTRLYYATDDFVAGADLLGLSAAVLGAAEDRRIAEADVVAAVSEQVSSRWDCAGQVAIVPNGCDVAAYAHVESAPLPDDVGLPSPIAGVVGQISGRIDLSLLEAVADSGISVLLVGPVQQGFEPDRMAGLLARPNVRWVGKKAFEDLPSYLRVIDVGLTPYVSSAFNRASFPLKTLEYLAAGRPVVSTPLPAVESLGAEWVRSAGRPDEFARATVDEARQARTPERVAARRAFAAGYSWESRVGLLVDLFEAASSPPGRGADAKQLNRPDRGRHSPLVP